VALVPDLRRDRRGFLSGLLVKGLNLGIEFKGGVEYTVSLPASQANEANANKIRDAAAATGIKQAANRR